MLCGSECWAVTIQHTHKMSVAVEDAKMDIWSYKIKNDHIRQQVQVAHIRLTWNSICSSPLWIEGLTSYPQWE